MRVLTIGTFDMFHRGHIRLLTKCQDLSRGEPPLIGVNSDEFVLRYKGFLPSVPEESRIASVEAYGEVWPHNGDTPDFIESMLGGFSGLIVIGSDWARRDYLAQLNVTQDWLDERDISVCYVPYTHGISSTILRESRV